MRRKPLHRLPTPQKNYEDKLFRQVIANFSPSLEKKLTEFAELTGMPKSRLICYAFDNELDQVVPFNYPCHLPHNIYVQDAYVAEATKISQYLLKFPYGVGRDILMLSRRDIGIENRATFMLAYRELLEKKIIEEVMPPPKVKTNYPNGYKFTRLTGDIYKNNIRQKKENLEKLKAEIEDQEKKIKEYNETWLGQKSDPNVKES